MSTYSIPATMTPTETGYEFRFTVGADTFSFKVTGDQLFKLLHTEGDVPGNFNS